MCAPLCCALVQALTRLNLSGNLITELPQQIGQHTVGGGGGPPGGGGLCGPSDAQR